MDKSTKRAQPRALSNELAIQQEIAPSGIRKGLHYALYELDGEQRAAGPARGSHAVAQLMLGETLPGGVQTERLNDVIGSDMTMAQRRAIHSLYVMLHDRRYRADEDRPVETPKGQRITRQSLIFTPIEYLEAYGLERAKSGRMPRAQRDEALEALNELARQPRKIVYRRQYKTNGKRRADMIVYEGTLLSIYKAYTDLEGEEMDSPDPPDAKRLKLIKVEMHSILTDELERYYYLQPRNWYKQLAVAYQEETGKTLRKLPEALDLLATWLRTLGPTMVKWEGDLPTYTISRDKLADKILPPSMIEQRRQARISRSIEQAINVSIRLGLLLKWELAMGGTGYKFWINPQKCSRLQKKALGSGEA